MKVAEQLDAVIERIAGAAFRAGRDPRVIDLIAVTKTHPAAVLRQFGLLAEVRGVRALFGENYIQEIKAKRAELGSTPEIHLIGPLQTNKVRDAVELCDVVQSAHSLKVIELIAKEALRREKRQRIFLQVNISADPQKSGLRKDELPQALALVQQLSNSVQLEGLMTITAFYNLPEDARPDYKKMAQLRAELIAEGYSIVFHGGAIRLSMGMSADFEVAIEEGADLIRVGTALFGERA
jgi:pyridoxal phosphate enzyme (YggS family)